MREVSGLISEQFIRPLKKALYSSNQTRKQVLKDMASLTLTCLPKFCLAGAFARRIEVPGNLGILLLPLQDRFM
jgi:hypothetical protein